MSEPVAHPMVGTPAACWVLIGVALVLAVWALLRRPRRAPARHQRVSVRVLWWRKAAPAAAVRRELAPYEMQLHDLAHLTDLFPDPADAEEGDHARH